jgi:hypothetical protein
MEKQLIYSKIAKVMAELEPIAKARKNTQQNYSFRGVDDLMNAISPKLTANGIFPVTQSVVDISSETVTSKSGGTGWRIVRRYTFRFYAEDGSFVDTTADGEAIDYGDKASNKAYSVAYREAMFKMFVIPVQNEDIEDADHDIKPVVKPTPTTQTNGNPAKPQPPKAIEQKRNVLKKRIAELCNEKALVPMLEAKDYVEFVKDNTGLVLESENYLEIITRLEALK